MRRGRYGTCIPMTIIASTARLLATRHLGLDSRLHPPGAMDMPPLYSVASTCRPANATAVYNAQRFTLNLTRADMVRAGCSPNIRLFEAAACATPIISDYWPGLETFFIVAKEVPLTQAAHDTLDYLRELPESERMVIGQRARARALAEHAAPHRAAELAAYICELWS
jgi:spore maturation protein CgeB